MAFFRKEPDPEPETPDPNKEVATKADLANITQQLEHVVEQFGNTLQALTHKETPIPDPVRYNAPTVEDVTPEEIESAIAEGGAGVGKLFKKALDANNARMLRDHILPLQQQGADTIGELAEEVGKGRMPHYELVKDEMARVLNQLDPTVRMQPKVRKHVYDTVVGTKLDAIVEQEVEKRLRQKDGEVTQDKANTGRKSPNDKDGPTFDEAFGAESMQALKYLKGQPDPDAFARKLGYKDSKEYLQLMLAEEGANG
jgi:hypothetical protein